MTSTQEKGMKADRTLANETATFLIQHSVQNSHGNLAAAYLELSAKCKTLREAIIEANYEIDRQQPGFAKDILNAALYPDAALRGEEKKP